MTAERSVDDVFGHVISIFAVGESSGAIRVCGVKAYIPNKEDCQSKRDIISRRLPLNFSIDYCVQIQHSTKKMDNGSNTYLTTDESLRDKLRAANWFNRFSRVDARTRQRPYHCSMIIKLIYISIC